MFTHTYPYTYVLHYMHLHVSIRTVAAKHEVASANIFIYIYNIYVYIHIYTHTRTVAARHEVASAMRHSVNPATPHTDAHSLAAAASAACVCERDVGLD